MKIEALHDIHDKKFSEDWSGKFEPTNERRQLFEMIFENLRIGKN